MIINAGLFIFNKPMKTLKSRMVENFHKIPQNH